MKTLVRTAENEKAGVLAMGPEGILLPLGVLGLLAGLLTLGAMLS